VSPACSGVSAAPGTAVAILLAAVWARNCVPRRGAQQYAVTFIAVLLATAVALIVMEAVETNGSFNLDVEGATLAKEAWHIGSDLVRYSFLGAVIASAWLYVRAEADHVAAMEQCIVDSERMDRETAEARLQMLEAQIEPHFLFNTLANVRRLYETDPAAGARMLRNLKDYLAVALPQLRATESTLGREVDHVTAYLNIQQIRMNRRLAFSIDVPESLRGARMPSLMLLTLVENAIKHGLGPLREGGRVDIRATVEDGRMRVDVADTGQGFAQQSAGGGTGLANTRARLASHYGTAAGVTLALNEPRGVIATILLPYESVTSAILPRAGAGTA
jgi:signal transduction histidine kinase